MGRVRTVGGTSDVNGGSVKGLSVMLELRRKNVRLGWRMGMVVVRMMRDVALVGMVASGLLMR